jgi:hypothetical protein
MTTRPIVLSEAEVADMLNCDIDTLRVRAGRGEIVGLKIGRGWVFPLVAFEESINRLAVQQAQAAGKRREPKPALASAVQQIPQTVKKQPPRLPLLQS